MNSCGTGKLRYRDEAAALQRRPGEEPTRVPAPTQRAYACPLCGGWHLTVTTPRRHRPM